MDLPFAGILLPQELLDLICSHLHARHDIRSARLVCRAFSAAASLSLRDPYQRPSLLFRSIDSDLFTDDSHAVTLWTWIDVPPETKIDDKTSDACQQLLDIASHIHHHRKYSNWDSPQVLRDFVNSTDCTTLRDYLENVAPGCISTSRSQITRFKTWHHAARRLQSAELDGYYEIRTHYFPSTMTQKQKFAFDYFMLKTRHTYVRGCIESMCGRVQSTRMPWCWLPGIYRIDGRDCVAARFLIPWIDAETEKDFHARLADRSGRRNYMEGSHDPRIVGVVSRFDDAVKSVGLLHTVSEHYTFVPGPDLSIKTISAM